VQERLGRLPAFLEFGALLNPLLNLVLPGSDVVGSLDSQARRRRLFDLVADILIDAADERGFVLVMEDLHWMDESSMALSAQLANRVGQAPILLLFTARPTESPLGVDGAGVSRLALTELSQTESLAMVRDVLDVADLPVEIGEAIYAKTKGNPLFLEEVIHSLQAPGVLERILTASSVTRAAELAALEIPDRVQGLLMSRVDRLAPDTKEVVKAGSVVGRSFDATLLRSLDDAHLRSVAMDRAFVELVAAALVVPADGGEGSSVTFRHALVQDVAYESLAFARRRELHAEVAHCLESTQASPDHAVLVHHYSRAGNGEKTRLHAIRASESSVAVYANLEAVDYLDIALGTVHGRTPADACVRSRLEELIGDSLQTLGQHDQAIQHYLAARRRWTSDAARRSSADVLPELAPIDDADARDSLLCWKMSVSMQRGPGAYRRAVRWLDIAAEALPAHRGGLAAKILIAKSMCLCRLARYQQSLSLGEEGLTLAREEDDLGLVAYGNTVRSLALSQLGQLEEAIATSREAIAVYEQVGDLVGQALGHLNLGLSYQLTDDPREALEEMERALAIYTRLGDQNGIRLQHLNIGAVLLQLGDNDEGVRHLEQTLSSRASEDCPPLQIGWALVMLAQAYLSMKELEAADRALREGREVLEGINAESFLLDTTIVEAQVALALGDLEQAERACSEVITAARSEGAAPIEGEALRILGQVRIAQCQPEAALTELRRALTLADETCSTYSRAQVLVVLAEAEAACAEADASCEDLLSEAIRLFERMGTRGDLAEALELRERLAGTL
jgi:tetratricopeptide (TPR) repeat protein